jgi:glycerate kinase
MANEAENVNRAMTLLREAAAVLAQNTSIGLHETAATDTMPTVDTGPNIGQSTQSFSDSFAFNLDLGIGGSNSGGRIEFND